MGHLLDVGGARSGAARNFLRGVWLGHPPPPGPGGPPHRRLGCSLAEDRLEGETIVCPCHGSRVALADGRALEGPRAYPQTVLETRVHNGQVEVRRAE
ncbi:MAG: Rieske (2Fe-2S) protein [Armatimonadota bacterium]|nr:Rieske (2Fe-2S) protein [Armatimonadota bacterium]MDR7448140.1 Rieske (2Fe-2S) protein [Armatimonadota bacterium]MDR7460478.1 Rieske (2Fe-2S) protein [Armatimonadota bacterium]MDR7478249.1 Rieske (2Fe-2S) protein [Armatimonadota bacterium]MDR7488862.1 Rieske (2Fe-2S) protein [Armatimonadota bacterium]